MNLIKTLIIILKEYFREFSLDIFFSVQFLVCNYHLSAIVEKMFCGDVRRHNTRVLFVTLAVFD